MGVQKKELAEARRDQALGHVLDHGTVGCLREADRAGKAQVVVARAHPEHRGKEGTVLGGCLNPPRDLTAYHCIGEERQVVSVLLQCANRADHHTVAKPLDLCPVSLAKLHGGRFGKTWYNSSMIWPRPLCPGGTIGLCSPAGASPAGAVERGAEALRRRGYSVVIAPNATVQHPDCDYLAGTEAQRLSDLNGLIRDPQIDLILAARGGYGAGKLLEGIDYDAFRTDPKPLVGYSDITALNLALASRGVISFSGIMATAGDGFGEDNLDPFSEASFFQAVRQESFVFTQPGDAPLTVHRGENTLTGPLFPVCLSLLESLLATPYVPDFTGGLLLIEDVYEELYAVDRALNHLRLAGVLGKLSGILIGSFNGFKDQRDAVLLRGLPHLALEAAPEHVAVISGFVYGHIPRRFTLPVGAEVAIDSDSGQLTVMRPVPPLGTILP